MLLNLSLGDSVRRISIFDWWYMFVMVVYMAMATPETSRMSGPLSGNPIPLLIPMVITFIIARRYRVSLVNKKLGMVLFFYLIWMILSLLKHDIYTISEFSFYFWPVYVIVVSFVQIKVFGKELLPLYENIMVIFCKIAIVCWLISILFPASDYFFKLFPESKTGNTLFYLFSWNDPLKTVDIYRNAGCSWEPGRFSIMIVLAVYCNICRVGVKFKGNNNVLWLLVALVTTFSTTGYVAILSLYFVSVVRKINVRSFLWLMVLIPVILAILTLNFMGEKLSEKFLYAQDVSRLDGQLSWVSKTYADGEYAGSIDRFDAIVFEWLNINEDPLLGYSNNENHSYFRKNISNNFVLANGLLKIFGHYGIPFGMIIFMFLFKSSNCLSQVVPYGRKQTLTLIMVISAISYPVFSIPVFTAFWMYGSFNKTKV